MLTPSFPSPSVRSRLSLALLPGCLLQRTAFTPPPTPPPLAHECEVCISDWVVLAPQAGTPVFDRHHSQDMAIGQIRALPVLPTHSRPQPTQPTSNPSPNPTPSPSPRPFPRPLPNLPAPTNTSHPESVPASNSERAPLPASNPERVLSPAPTTSSSISSASAYHSGHEHGASSVSDLSYSKDKDTTELGEIVSGSGLTSGSGSNAVSGSGSTSGKENDATVPQVKVHEPPVATTTTTAAAAPTTNPPPTTATTTNTNAPSSPTTSQNQTGSPSLVSRLGKKKRQLSRDLLRLPPAIPALPPTLPIGDYPEMIAQHHMHTMGLHSPPPASSSSGWRGEKEKDPQTPTRAGRLNLGLFSSRARKESASAVGVSVGSPGGRRPSAPSAFGVGAGGITGTGAGGRDDTPGASLRKRGSTSGSPRTQANLAALFGGSGRVSPGSPSQPQPQPQNESTSSSQNEATSSQNPATSSQNQPSSSVQNQPTPPAQTKAGSPKSKPITPPKPSKFKAGNILGTALGMGVGGRGSTGIMPNSPSIAAAIEYMRHEQDRDPRGSFSARRTIGPGKSSLEADGKSSLDGGESSMEGGQLSLECGESGLESGKSSMESGRVGFEGKAGVGSEMDDLGAETSSGPASSVGSLSRSVSSSGTSEVVGWREDTLDVFPPVPGQTAFQQPSFPFIASNLGLPSPNSNNAAPDWNSQTRVPDSNTQMSSGSNPQARPHPPARQDPDKRVSSSSSQRTLTAFNSKRESGIFVFPGIEGVVRLEGGTPLARMHTTDGIAQAGFGGQVGAFGRHSGGYERHSGIYDQHADQLSSGYDGQVGALNSQADASDPDKGKFDAPIPRPARIGQLSGSLKRRSASMSILLPPTRVPPPESESASSEASSPRFAPPPLPPRRPPMPDGAVTDSEGYMSSASNAGRRWGRPAGIKGKIAAWTAAAEGNGRRKHPRVGGGGSANEPRRSDSPHQPVGQNQGYPYSHSPASAPALQVHTHLHLPSHAHSQTPLMSIAALAPAARDLALGVGKRVEKFYRQRSTSGAGHGEPHPAMAMRVGSPGMSSIGVGSEPALPPPIRPAVPGASGLVFGRPLDDVGVPKDVEGWVDEGLGVRRCVGLPVFVSRCVRHLEKWGGDEEGLFRISGRPSHVSRLRAEFDAGADYELSEIQPGDLDPHAVSSLFKAYLRELPDPILTRTLKHQFDLAMTTPDNTSNASFDLSKLPTSMTSFGESTENMRSVDASLLTDIKVLIDQLPQVNYNLLHELCHLLRYTTQHAHTTKMPLGNLLLLFCPTLSFSAGFLRCLVEGQDTLFEWGRQAPAARAPTPTPALPAAPPNQPPAAPPALPPRTVKISDATTTVGSSKHAASSSLAPASVRSLKSPLNVSTDLAQARARSQTTTGSAPPSRASMFFPSLGPRRPSITMLFGGGSNRNSGDGNQTPRHSSSSGDSSGMSEEEPYVNPKRQTRPPRVSLDIPDGSFSPSLSPPKARVGVPQREPSPTKRNCQTPIADLFKSQLTAAAPTTAPSPVTVTGTSVGASSGNRSSPNKTLPPRLGLPFRETEESVDEMGWSRGVLDAASASLGAASGQR